jgi:hypothetical protein
MMSQATSTSGTPVTRWRVAGVSVQGVSHLKTNQPCQDSHVSRQLPGGALVIAVADGAGSAPLSQIGSARAAVAAVDWVTELMSGDWPTTEADWRALLTAALETAHESVHNLAHKRKVTPRDLATTLILTIATPKMVVTAQVGDGAAVVMTEHEEFAALTFPQRGEFVNETVFFTSPDYLAAVQFGFWHGDVAGVAAFSDGLQFLALRMPDGQPHSAFFLPLLRMLGRADDHHRAEAQLRGFLQSDRITQRADDDLTLVLATRHETP